MADIPIRSLDDLRTVMRQTRKSRHLDQNDLARAAGVNRKTVIGIERSADPQFESVLKAAQQLNIEVVFRVSDEPSETKEPAASTAAEIDDFEVEDENESGFHP